MVALSIPGRSLPQASVVMEFDKVVHAGLFAVLTGLWLLALSGGSIQKGLAILAVIIAFGIGTEFYQEWMPIGRTADFMDSAADAVGALIGFLAWFILKSRLERGPASDRTNS